MPGRRVIVHAGFHKTGTTTTQNFLHANTKHLWKRCRLILPRHIRSNAARMAARYSHFKTSALLDAYGDDLREALSKVNVEHDRKILISEENLSGRMPGRDGHMSYDAAPALMARTEDVVCDVFGAETDVVFHFTTRDADAWLLSTYKHNLRETRLKMDHSEYAETYRPAAAFNDVIKTIADNITGLVETSNLADLTGTEGPAEPLIDLIKLPPHRRAALIQTATQNVGPRDDQIDALLKFNRSELSDEDLAAAKKMLLKKDAPQ